MAITTKNVNSTLVFNDTYILNNTHRTRCVEIRYWSRWLFASVSNYFATIIENTGYTFIIEGNSNLQKFIEFRMNGPSVVRLNSHYFRLDVEINLLWSFIQGHEDLHQPARIQGILMRSMKDICIYRYGEGPFDDQSLLGILKLKNNRRDTTRNHNFGIVNPDTKLMQGTVEGSYHMHLSCN